MLKLTKSADDVLSTANTRKT